MKMPDKATLQGSNTVAPYVFVGDDAFPLKHNLMKPYPAESIRRPERVFNYRLSKARRVIENTFGIAASRFRVLRRPIIACVELVVAATKEIVVLHNYLMEDTVKGMETQYYPHGFVDSSGQANGAWRSEVTSDNNFLDLSSCNTNTYSREEKSVRDSFRNYFNSSQGEVPWQWDTVDSVTNSFDKRPITS